MRSLELTLAPGEESLHPLFPLMTDAPFVDGAWMLDWNATRAETTTVLFRVEGEPDPFDDALGGSPVVLDHEVTPVGADSSDFYAYIHSEALETERRLWLAFTQERSLLVPPLEYRGDGTVTCRILGTPEELRAALDEVPDGIETRVDRVGEFTGRPGIGPEVLTDRQVQVVRAAVDAGYYEVPRLATAADVAERVGCSPSTASEHLRRAEARIVPAVVDA